MIYLRRITSFLVIALSFIFLSLAAPSVNAQVMDKTCTGSALNSSVCKAGSDDPITGDNGIIMKITRVISYIIGFVAVLMIIIAGLKFVTANGNSESIASARNTIIYALIGVVIAAFSQLIVRFVISII